MRGMEGMEGMDDSYGGGDHGGYDDDTASGPGGVPTLGDDIKKAANVVKEGAEKVASTVKSAASNLYNKVMGKGGDAKPEL